VLQRLIAAVLGVLGLLAIGLGVASSTVWRGDDILVATASPDAHLVVADPGVLELAGNPVTVTVHAADDTPVVIAVGRDTDVTGWVGTDPHAQVTGLAAWHVLRTETVAEPAPTPAASAAPEPAATQPAATDPSASATSEPAAGGTAAAANPAGSDLWVAQATGNGTATLTWNAQPGRWSLLVASLGESSPVIELAWPRTVTTPWLWPGVVGGALVFLTGLGLGGRLWIRARRGLTEPEWHPVLTGAMPTVGVGGVGSVSADATETVVLTRRQLREAEAANGPAARRRGREASDDAPPTGSHPLLLPVAERAAPTELPAPAEETPPAVATGVAPEDAPPAARREVGRPHSHAAQPTPPAALPSYFLRPRAPGAAPTAPAGPVAPRGRTPGGTEPESGAPGSATAPGPARSPAPRGVERSDAPTATGGSDQPFAPRPTWSAGKPVTPDAPSDEAPDEPPSARADAWRRAWGFPGHDAGGADDAAGTTDEGTHR
jgi:hypothetical protein